MATTKIEWATHSWNPVTGCSPVSEGCQNCYARRMAQRLKGRYGYPQDNPFRVTFHPDRLGEPLRWRKPSRIFVCSMGDLFHENVPFEWLERIWDVIFDCSFQEPNIGGTHHIFIILTKRPERVIQFSEYLYLDKHRKVDFGNIWLGVTIENQYWLEKRLAMFICEMRKWFSGILFVSFEPLLGPIDKDDLEAVLGEVWLPGDPDDEGDKWIDGLNWVIVGGETGPGARPMHPNWVRSIRNQCQESETAFFFKKWGDFPYSHEESGTRFLDGRLWEEYPTSP